MEQITVEELKHRVQENKNLHILDVREQDEFDEFNIGATFLPLSRLRNMEIDEIEDWDENEPIIVHCRSGKRSVEACMLLSTMGYAHPINLIDGILGWKEKYGLEKIK